MTDKQIIIDGVDVNDCHNKTFYKNDEGDVQCKCYRFEDADSDTLLFGICKQHPHCYYKQLKRKEQECEELKKIIKEAKNSKLDLNSFFAIEATVGEYQLELDQLKAEVKSKTEYIQEQRDIINQYSKEIEMYKKCQGKRASKREEELKAENDNIKKTFDGLFKVQYKLADNNKKLRQCLTEIKEIADWKNEYWSLGIDDYKNMADEILEKISEVENG